MSIRRHWLNWGVFLIALGAMPLLVYWNVLDPSVVRDLVRLWPLVLIALGIGMILRFTPLAALGGVATAAVLGVLIGSLVAGGWGGLGSVNIACRTDSGIPVESRTGTLSGQPSTVTVELNCGELAIDRQPGSDWSVTTQIAGELRPIIEASPDSLRLRNGEGADGSIRRNWNVRLPQATSIGANLTINAGESRVDLGGGPVSTLNGTFNASDSQVVLAGATEVSALNLTYNASSGTVSVPASSGPINVSLNASSLTLCVPAGTGLSVKWDGVLSGQNFAAAGLQTQGNDRWIAGGEGQLLVSIDANVSNLNLDRTGDCQ